MLHVLKRENLIQKKTSNLGSLAARGSLKPLALRQGLLGLGLLWAAPL